MPPKRNVQPQRLLLENFYQVFIKYWVGQKVPSGFSTASYWPTQHNDLLHTISSRAGGHLPVHLTSPDTQTKESTKKEKDRYISLINIRQKY